MSSTLYPDVMIDLETVGTRPTSAILSIGAIKFNKNTKDIGPSFYKIVNLNSCYDIGLTSDPETLKWWAKQSEEAKEIFNQDGTPIKDTLELFKNYLYYDSLKIWGNGSDFDNVILANAYRASSIDLPWKFYNNRCYRTFKSSLLIRPKITNFSGVKHNALDDAKNQAIHLQELIKLNSSSYEIAKYKVKDWLKTFYKSRG